MDIVPEKKIGRKPGRARLEEGERRESVTIAMSPNIYSVVHSSSKLGSFSLKIEKIIKEWSAYKEVLIQYQDDYQKESGEPVRLNKNATRIYSCSPFANGFCYQGTPYELRVKEIVTALRKGGVGQGWVDKTLVPALRKEGYIVQVVDELEHDLYDVWIADPMLGEVFGNCSKCSVVSGISEFVNKIKEGL